MGPAINHRNPANKTGGKSCTPILIARVGYCEPTCTRCGQTKTRIGEEVSEELDYVPASFVVRQHLRPKYACKHCQDGVVIAELPDRPIDKGRAGTGLFSVREPVVAAPVESSQTPSCP